MTEWVDLDLDRERAVEYHLTYDGRVKIEFSKSSLKTDWVDLDDLGDVFMAPAKCHIVLGSKAFVAGKGKEVAARLKVESAEYARVECALKVRAQNDGVMLFGPFLTNCSSSLEL